MPTIFVGRKHQAFRDSRDMFPEAVRAVREARPAAFIFENVKGLKRATFLNYFQYIVLQLSYPSMSRMHDESWVEHLCRLELNHTGRHSSAEIEYRVVAHSANAANFGIPQRRERIFFIGFRADLGVSWAFPNETHSLDALLWDQIRDGDYWERHRIPIKQRQIDVRHTTRAERMAVKPETRPWVTVRDSICDLPDPELQPGKAKSCLNHFSNRVPEVTLAIQAVHWMSLRRRLRRVFMAFPAVRTCCAARTAVSATSRYERVLGFRHSPMTMPFTDRGARRCANSGTRFP